MSSLHLYALLSPAPGLGDLSDLGAGLAGEPLRLVGAAGLRAACGEVDEPPAATAAALAAHDAVVRRLAAASPAVLPFRFGQSAADPAALAAALAPRAAELAAALSRVAGCVQMTLRVFAAEAAAADTKKAVADEAKIDETAGSGPGARYLASRLRRERSPLALPGVAALRAALRPLVRAERLERHGPGRLLLSVHDLVPAEAAAGYRAEVEAASARRLVEGGPRVTVSGPWPPYAFGAAALGGERR